MSIIEAASDAVVLVTCEYMQTDLRSTCQYTMIPGPPYRWCHSVMKFADHDPNLRESDAHEVPGPHKSTSRASSVLFTTVRIAARRLSRLMKNRRVRRSATSVSASAPASLRSRRRPA
jgi:hypothetical protein